MLPAESGQTLEETLIALGRSYPFSLTKLGTLGVEENVPGAPEIGAILQTLDAEAGNIPEDPELAKGEDEGKENA